MKTYILLLTALLGFQNLLQAQNTTTSEFNITRDEAILYGTLVMPADSKKDVPVVLLIAGTGQMNRDLNLGMGRGSNAYKMLADSFAAAGIASVRYDKRGVGQSEAALKYDSLLSFEDYIADAIAYLKKIKSHRQFGDIYLAGHSEGALVAMVAANKFPVQGLICMEAPGERNDITLKKQIDKNIPNQTTELDTILSQIRAGKRVKIQNKYLITIFRPSVQPYLSSLFAHDPQEEIRKIKKVPVLLINGTHDLQMPEENARLLKNANPAVTLKLIPGMNYVLKEVPADLNENVASYNDPSQPVSAALVDEMVRFCRAGR